MSNSKLCLSVGHVHIQMVGHAAFQKAHVHVHPARHLDRAAEGDLAVALAQVQVADAQAGAVHIDREKAPNRGMKPPVQSKASRMKSLPGLAQQAIGLSGCQRLWLTRAWGDRRSEVKEEGRIGLS